MKRHLACLVAAIVPAALPAYAGGMDEPIASPAPIYAPVPVGFDWSGFDIGGQLG